MLRLAFLVALAGGACIQQATARGLDEQSLRFWGFRPSPYPRHAVAERRRLLVVGVALLATSAACALASILGALR